jgi:hypothetical protein
VIRTTIAVMSAQRASARPRAADRVTNTTACTMNAKHAEKLHNTAAATLSA